MRRLVILGGGFAGVWAAYAAAAERQRHTANAILEIVLVSRDPWLTIRPRLYEHSLEGMRVPLDEVLSPIGVKRIQGEVRRIDTLARTVSIGDTGRQLSYDRLLFALGSAIRRPSIPGIEQTFSVDTGEDAIALHARLDALRRGPASRETAVAVVGAGFTGIEVATTLAARVRTILLDSAPHVAPDLGPDARVHVTDALARLRVETRTGVAVRSVDGDGIVLANGERVPADVVVWTGGLRASPLAAQLAAPLDAAGRLEVDQYLRVRGSADVFAAGDVAHALADEFGHVTPMSCQCAIPMGEAAGANAAADLFDAPLAEFRYPDYVTCLDLGAAGALFMEGWDRQVRVSGFWGSVLKESINQRLIYPPWRRDTDDAHGAPVARSAA